MIMKKQGDDLGYRLLFNFGDHKVAPMCLITDVGTVEESREGQVFFAFPREIYKILKRNKKSLYNIFLIQEAKINGFLTPGFL